MLFLSTVFCILSVPYSYIRWLLIVLYNFYIVQSFLMHCILQSYWDVNFSLTWLVLANCILSNSEVVHKSCFFAFVLFLLNSFCKFWFSFLYYISGYNWQKLFVKYGLKNMYSFKYDCLLKTEKEKKKKKCVVLVNFLHSFPNKLYNSFPFLPSFWLSLCLQKLYAS